MRAFLKILTLTCSVGALYLLGGCSSSYDPYYYGYYDNDNYYRNRPVGVYYYQSRDPYAHRYSYYPHSRKYTRDYPRRYDRDYHRDGIRIHGDLHVRD